jgi:hypothetical protein
MNIYDFDGTIYGGDSTVDFFFFCLRHYPRTWRSLIKILWGVVLFCLHVISKTAFKERFFSFLCYLPDTETAVSAFWNTHERKIKTWYLSQKKQSDIIISASPEFLLKPICNKLGVRLIASRVDSATGRYTGINCHGAEKVRRLAEATGITEAEAFYSDSLSDQPLANIAAQAFFVRKDRISPWKNERGEKQKK